MNLQTITEPHLVLDEQLDLEPHFVDEVQCNWCGHDWIAIWRFETPATTLKCPACGAQDSERQPEED